MEIIRFRKKKPKSALLYKEPKDFKQEVNAIVTVDAHSIVVQATHCTIDAPNRILDDETLVLTIVPDTYYVVVPEAIHVYNASYTFDSDTNQITISEPTGAVTIDVLCKGQQYPINSTVIGATISGPETIRYNTSAFLYLTANEGWTLPETISVTGADYEYNRENRSIRIYNPVPLGIGHGGKVDIVVTCTATVYVLGVEGEGSSSGELTRTDMAVGLSYAKKTQATQGKMTITSDFSYVFPYNQIEEVTIGDNVFIKIPKHYTKYTYDSETGLMKTQISNVQGEGYILNPCFRNDAGVEQDCVLIGKYEATGTSSLAGSVSGEAPLTNITFDGMRTACKANGTDYGMLDYWTWRMLQDLFKIEFATTNSQSVMNGNTSTSSVENTGECDRVSRIGSGSNINNGCMIYRGIENLYGNISKWCDGLGFSVRNIYVCYDPTAYEGGKTSSPYQIVSYYIAENVGNVSARGFDSNNPIVWEATNTNGNTNFDSYWFDFTTNGGSNPCPAVGGDHTSVNRGGLWCLVALGTSYANSGVGGRLIYRKSQGE